jgi:hypothetical protein
MVIEKDPWAFYTSANMRCLYKNRWLAGKGYSAAQRSEIMRKFKVYVDRINTAPIIGRKVRKAENTAQLISILDSVFSNEWKNHIKDNYKDMPYYFRDYAKFGELIGELVQMVVGNIKLRVLYWPDGSPLTTDDLLHQMGKKHDHIKMTIDGETKVYSGSNAIIRLCRHIGFFDVAKFNLTTNGMRLLVRHVPLGRETKYMEAGDGWHLCTSCDTKVKLRLIKIIAAHFGKDIKVELI